MGDWESLHCYLSIVQSYCPWISFGKWYWSMGGGYGMVADSGAENHGI
jgi:hypothetical protein